VPPKVDGRAELLKLIQELEQEREAYSKMQEVNRQKTLFLGSAAHESVTSESVALSTAARVE
jgi:hypothetical protein